MPAPGQACIRTGEHPTLQSATLADISAPAPSRDCAGGLTDIAAVCVPHLRLGAL
jgi:hypothetical protein